MRLAFIGGFGHHYLRAAVTDPACDIDSPVAVASDGIDPQSARAFARSLPNSTWYDHPIRMLDHFLPHAVSVGAVYGSNSDLAAAALERDIPVVCDKPAAATWEQFHRLEQLTQDPRRVILTEFDFRSRPEINAARQSISDGLLGNIGLAIVQKSYRFNTRPAWYADRSSYTGTLMWIASHGIDLIPFLTGRQYKTVTGAHGNVSQPSYGSFDDHVVVLFQLDNGGSAIVHADFLRPAKAPTHGDDRVRVIGSKGLIEIRDRQCLLTTHDQPQQNITSQGIARPLHVELLAALQGQSEKYGTASTLQTAELLLQARDALDKSAIEPIK